MLLCKGKRLGENQREATENKPGWKEQGDAQLGTEQRHAPPTRELEKHSLPQRETLHHSSTPPNAPQYNLPSCWRSLAFTYPPSFLMKASRDKVLFSELPELAPSPRLTGLRQSHTRTPSKERKGASEGEIRMESTLSGNHG